jgi:hypothetical protein
MLLWSVCSVLCVMCGVVVAAAEQFWGWLWTEEEGFFVLRAKKTSPSPLVFPPISLPLCDSWDTANFVVKDHIRVVFVFCSFK